MGLLSHVNLTRIAVCLAVHRFRNSLKTLFHAQVHTYLILNMTKFSPVNKINYPYVLFLGSPLFIYFGIRQLLLVAHCQLSSSTMGILLVLHLSRQHIIAYLY